VARPHSGTHQHGQAAPASRTSARPARSGASSGEVRNIAAVRRYLDELADAGDYRQGQTEQAVAVLESLRLDGLTLAEATGVIVAAAKWPPRPGRPGRRWTTSTA
jgi:hypothetical protein